MGEERDSDKEGAKDKEKDAICDCPIRSKPPPLSDKMPFNDREVDIVDKLQQWLLKRYAASAFNVCTHQPLPKMSGPKLKLIVDPSVTPVAKHVPAPVPWHFKAGLEADCRMGVLEELPANTSVEWMSRMITPSKKNGEPRRTVDLSHLNKKYKRQTHHTKSP